MKSPADLFGYFNLLALLKKKTIVFKIITLCLYVYVSLSLLNKMDDFHEKLETNIIPHSNSYNQLQHEDECVGM